MDKTGKDTGPGKVREEVRKQDGVVVVADLFNYNIDGNFCSNLSTLIGSRRNCFDCWQNVPSSRQVTGNGEQERG